MGRVSAQPSRVERDEALRRRRDELVVAEVEVAGERRGVDRAQRVVEVQARQRVQRSSRCERLAWKMSPANTYSRVRRDDVLVLRPREVGAEHRQVVAVQRGGGGVARAREGCAHARRLGRRRACVRGEAVEQHRLAAREVVAQQPAGQEDVDVGEAEVVARACRAGARGSARRRRRGGRRAPRPREVVERRIAGVGRRPRPAAPPAGWRRAAPRRAAGSRGRSAPPREGAGLRPALAATPAPAVTVTTPFRARRRKTGSQAR